MTNSHRIRSSLPLVLALALAATTVARAQIEEPRIPLQTKMSELTRFRTEYAENFNKKDINAVVAMYSRDVIVVEPTGNVIKGIDGVRAWFTQGAANLPHLVIESDSMTVYGNTAVDVGTAKQHPAAGGEMVARYIVVLRRDLNGWKIVRLINTPVTTGGGM
ncbi:MAG: nuclear transport factor 2 family protein [Gemmatimonadota bacterium]